MNVGALSSRSVLLAPIRVMKSPNDNVPSKAPMQSIDPIHETSSFVSGPDISVVWSPVNIGKAGDNHPMIDPIDTEIKFARKKSNAHQVVHIAMPELKYQ